MADEQLLSLLAEGVGAKTTVREALGILQIPEAAIDAADSAGFLSWHMLEVFADSHELDSTLDVFLHGIDLDEESITQLKESLKLLTMRHIRQTSKSPEDEKNSSQGSASGHSRTLSDIASFLQASTAKTADANNVFGPGSGESTEVSELASQVPTKRSGQEQETMQASSLSLSPIGRSSSGKDVSALSEEDILLHQVSSDNNEASTLSCTPNKKQDGGLSGLMSAGGDRLVSTDRHDDDYDDDDDDDDDDDGDDDDADDDINDDASPLPKWLMSSSEQQQVPSQCLKMPPFQCAPKEAEEDAPALAPVEPSTLPKWLSSSGKQQLLRVQNFHTPPFQCAPKEADKNAPALAPLEDEPAFAPKTEDTLDVPALAPPENCQGTPAWAPPEAAPALAPPEDVPVLESALAPLEDVPVLASPEHDVQDVPALAPPEDDMQAVLGLAPPEDLPVLVSPWDVPALAPPEDLPALVAPGGVPALAPPEHDMSTSASSEDDMPAPVASQFRTPITKCSPKKTSRNDFEKPAAKRAPETAESAETMIWKHGKVMPLPKQMKSTAQQPPASPFWPHDATPLPKWMQVATEQPLEVLCASNVSPAQVIQPGSQKKRTMLPPAPLEDHTPIVSARAPADRHETALSALPLESIELLHEGSADRRSKLEVEFTEGKAAALQDAVDSSKTMSSDSALKSGEPPQSSNDGHENEMKHRTKERDADVHAVRDHWDEESQTEYFAHIGIARDGGLADLTTLRKLFTWHRWLSAFFQLMLLCGNIWFLTGYNIWENWGQPFVLPVAESPHLSIYLSNAVIGAITGYHINSCFIVSIVEYTLFLYYAVAIGYQCVMIIKLRNAGKSSWLPPGLPGSGPAPNLAGNDEKQDFEFWNAVATLLWRFIPGLSSDSALGCLHYVIPSIALPVLKSDLDKVLNSHGRMSRHHVLELIRFFALRICALFAGLEAFSVKCVEASHQLQQLTGGGLWLSALCIFVPFLNQVLGIVRVSIFAESRLFLFVFGGPDSLWSGKEEEVCSRWKARLASKTWRVAQEYYPQCSLLWFLSVVCTYSDADFQLLLLSNAEKVCSAKAVRNSKATE